MSSNLLAMETNDKNILCFGAVFLKCENKMHTPTTATILVSSPKQTRINFYNFYNFTMVQKTSFKNIAGPIRNLTQC